MKKVTSILSVLLLLNSCSLLPDSPENKIEPEFDFDYRTTNDVSVTIYFRDSRNNNIPDVPVTISLSKNFESDSSIIASTSTGKSGIVEILANIPLVNDSIYVRADYVGFPSLWSAPIKGSYVDWNAKQTIETSQKIDEKLNDGGRIQGYPYTIETLGTWNSNGFPNYLTMPNDYVDPGLLSRINASLPETKPVPTYNPEYLTSTDKSLQLKEEADVWVTFVHEGAGYKNTLGFYVYDKASPPQTINDIKKVKIIFPNVSFAGSGGELQSGNKVYIGRFQANHAIGWVLFANAFSGGTVGNGNWAVYSNQILNNYIIDPVKRQQNVQLNDAGFNRVVLSFEDIRRDNSSCDNDFNDAIFYVTTNPPTAVVTTDMPVVDVPLDSDGDGVTDSVDQYPTDATKAYNQYFPTANTFNSIAFEDLWPSRGDYDFNDLVMGYNAQHILNSANQVVEVKLKYELRAIGATNNIGFAVNLPVSKGMVRQVNITPSPIHTQLMDGNGTETGQTQTVIPLFDDAHDIIQQSSGSFTNTESFTKFINPTQYQVVISFQNPVSPSMLGTAPYNSFIYVNNRSVEVHLPNQPPTLKANLSMLGTSADKSSVSKGKYYLTMDGKPWGIIVPSNFDYPAEKQPIELTYLYFNEWATSQGTIRKDWYANSVGYRNSNRIYRKP